MIYRSHCRHGDFCQPALRSKVGVQTAVPWSDDGLEDGVKKGLLTKISGL